MILVLYFIRTRTNVNRHVLLYPKTLLYFLNIKHQRGFFLKRNSLLLFSTLTELSPKRDILIFITESQINQSQFCFMSSIPKKKKKKRLKTKPPYFKSINTIVFPNIMNLSGLHALFY